MIVHTERAIKTTAIIEALKSVGYTPIGRPIMPKPKLLGILVIACNTIGEMMSVHPYRVFQAMYVRLSMATRGMNHEPRQSKYVRAGEHQDAEDIRILCPCCGADLLTAGAPTKDEIVRDIKAKSPNKSPQSSKNERAKSPEEGNAKEVER